MEQSPAGEANRFSGCCTIYLKCTLIGLNSHTQKLYIFSNPPMHPFTKLVCRLDRLQVLNAMTSARSISAWLLRYSRLKLDWIYPSPYRLKFLSGSCELLQLHIRSALIRSCALSTRSLPTHVIHSTVRLDLFSILATSSRVGNAISYSVVN